MKIHSRPLQIADFEQIKKILYRDGLNDWNYLTAESVEAQFQLIREGTALAVLAETDEIIGFAILIFKQACPEKLCQYADLSTLAYINDVAVNALYRGQGIGSRLLNKSIEIARHAQCDQVFIERHEENLASAGMMRKAAFSVVDTFYDPQRRTVGSRNTALLARRTSTEG